MTFHSFRKGFLAFLISGLLLQACSASWSPFSSQAPAVTPWAPPVGTPVVPITPLPSITPAFQQSTYLPLAPNNSSAPEQLADVGASVQVTDTLSTWVEQTLAGMTIEQKIGQMIITGVEGSSLTPETCDFIRWLQPGGVTFQHGNIDDPESLKTYTAGLQECSQAVSPVPMFMTLAHEGEYINRYLHGVTVFPAALALGAAGDPSVAFQVSYASGQELAYSGINMVLGPVADVLTNYDNDVVSQRTFGGNVDLVSQFVSQAVAGYRQAGVIPVLKHFPGHGGVAEDSHQTLPVDTVDMERLRSVYLPPFHSGLDAGAPVLMFSHIAYPAISGEETPATLSEAMIRFTRQEMNFQGPILSDSLRMKAVTSNKTVGVYEVSVQAAETGIDLLLLNSPEQARVSQEFLLAAYDRGELSLERIDDAVRRVLSLKASWGLSAFPLPGATAPDWQADAQLAYTAGKYAVALLRNEKNLVPLPQDTKRVLVIGPGTEWEFYPVLEKALQERGMTVDMVHYSPPWDGPVEEQDYLDSLPRKAAGYDAVLMFTWQVHLNRLAFEDTWQADLVEKMVKKQRPLVVIAIKSPTDIIEFPDVPTYMAMFGSTQGQIDAVLQALLGEWQPAGRDPLPGLMP